MPVHCQWFSSTHNINDLQACALLLRSRRAAHHFFNNLLTPIAYPSMTGPLLTLPVHDILRAAQRAGATTVVCSLDLDRTRTTVTVGATGWSWQGREYPYLETCKERTIHYWTGHAFEPVQRLTNSLI